MLAFCLGLDERKSCRANLPVESSQTSGGGSDGASGSVVSVEVVVIIVIAVVIVVTVGRENSTGNNGTGGKGAEPEDVQIDVENKSSPVVEGAGSARVSADEPDGNNQGAETL